MLKLVAFLAALIACTDGFKYKNCGNEAVRLNHLSISPDAIHLPGQLRVTGSATVNRNINGNLEVKVEMKKKMLFWIKVPCIKGIGSCMHRNICGILNQMKCPAGTQCHCPFTPGTIKFDEVINLPSIPSALKVFAKGSIKVKGSLLENGQEVGCVEVETSIK